MESKLQLIVDELGYDSIDELLTTAIIDSVVPGICTKCNYVEIEMEPETELNPCDCCNSQASVSSCLVIAEI